MRKRRGSEDLFGDSDESDASDDTIPDEKAKEKDKGKEKEVPPSTEKPRGPGRSDRGVTSPGSSSRHLSPTPTKGKSSTAPPVSGASFIAQRATSISRGVSPASRSRQASPRAGSPDVGSRAGSPAGRAQSPVAESGREGTPSIKLKLNSAGSSSGSPAPSPNPKRKPSPGGDTPRKKKKGSNTPTPAPEDIEPFPGMITKDEIVAWFRGQKSDRVPMGEVIKAFKPRLVQPSTAELREKNQKLFQSWVGMVTVKGGDKTLQFKAEYK